MPVASEIVHTEISDVSKAFAVLGFFIVVYGQVSYVVKERLYLSEPLIAVTLGIVVGPYVLGWVDPFSWSNTENYHETTYQFTRLVVGIQVLFTGIALPKAYLRRESLSLLVLLFGIMTTAWFVTALLVWGLVRMPASVSPDGIGYSLTFLESLAIAAAVTPTDPVLANSITKGRYAEKHVPANVRNIILAESGANDGLGFPFLYLAIYLLDRSGVDRGTSVGTEVGRWVYAVVIYQIVLSCVYGFLLGFVARKTLKWAESRKYIDKDSFFAFGLGLALFTLGTTGLFGSDDILACFIAGNSFTWDDWFRIRSEESDIQDILDMLLNAAVFVYIGAIIPWDFYSVAGTMTGTTSSGIPTWRIVLLGIFVLLLRRPPWVVAAMKGIPALTTLGEAAFAGWFGPIGVGAVFYIEVALRQIPDDGTRDRLRTLYSPVVLFCVFSSVLTHGVTIPISKLGPSIVRRTATISRTRSITLTSKPPTRTNTLTATRDAGPENEHEREQTQRRKWNPLYSFGKGVLSVALFWRKDSFWRRDINGSANAQPHEVKISGPSHPVKRPSIEEAAAAAHSGSDEPTQESDTTVGGGADADGGISAEDDTAVDADADADAAPKGPRPPPPALQLPTTAAAAGVPPPAQAHVHTPAVNAGPGATSWPHRAHLALEGELARERAEAQDEAREWERGLDGEGERAQVGGEGAQTPTAAGNGNASGDGSGDRYPSGTPSGATTPGLSVRWD